MLPERAAWDHLFSLLSSRPRARRDPAATVRAGEGCIVRGQAGSSRLVGDDAHAYLLHRPVSVAGGMGRREEGSQYGARATADFVFVADPEAHCVRQFTRAGTMLSEWGERGHDEGQFEAPEALACDGRGSVYVADTGNHRIQKFTTAGRFVAAWGARGAAIGCFDGPVAIVADANGGVWVCDSGNRRVQHLWSSGSFLRFMGAWGAGAGGDPGLQDPQSIAIDREGRVLVGDASSCSVRVYDGDGALLRAIDLPAQAGESVAPCDIAIGPAGEIYVCDAAGHLVHGLGAHDELLGSGVVVREDGVRPRRRSEGFPYVTLPHHGVSETARPL